MNRKEDTNLIDAIIAGIGALLMFLAYAVLLLILTDRPERSVPHGSNKPEAASRDR